MRRFIISAAALTAFAALLASAPANADYNFGAVQNAGQCWKATLGYARDASFGYWGACPRTASVAITRTVQRRISR